MQMNREKAYRKVIGRFPWGWEKSCHSGEEGHEETSENETYVYHNCNNGFLVIYTCQILENCTLSMSTIKPQ